MTSFSRWRSLRTSAVFRQPGKLLGIAEDGLPTPLLTFCVTSGWSLESYEPHTLQFLGKMLSISDLLHNLSTLIMRIQSAHQRVVFLGHHEIAPTPRSVQRKGWQWRLLGPVNIPDCSLGSHSLGILHVLEESVSLWRAFLFAMGCVPFPR